MAKSEEAKKPLTKTEILTSIAEETELTRKQVSAVFEALSGQIKKSLGNRGPGTFAIPGLVKIEKKKVPDPIQQDPPVVPGAKAILPAANVNPLPIAAAPPTFGKASLKLPGSIGSVCLAGGGRFLILTIPSQRQLAILDVNERKVAKYIPLAGDQPVIAAGLQKLVIAYPEHNTIQRWNLLTFEKELTVNSPFTGTVIFLRSSVKSVCEKATMPS